MLKPTFTKQQIANLDKQAKLSRAYDGTTYLPGIVGLNNIKANDYANAVLQVGWRRPSGRLEAGTMREGATREHCEAWLRNSCLLVECSQVVLRPRALPRTLLGCLFCPKQNIPVCLRGCHQMVDQFQPLELPGNGGWSCAGPAVPSKRHVS